MRDVALLGIGTALPPRAVEQASVIEHVKEYSCRTEEEARLLRVLYRRSGVRRRASVTLDGGPVHPSSFFPPPTGADDRGPSTAARMELYQKEAPALALAAAEAALAAAGIGAAEISQLVTVSCTGFVAPGFDIALLASLPLGACTGRTHVGFMGCHGALNGLRVGRAMVGAGMARRVLVCATELCSIHFQYGWDPDMVVANSLFADGAAAVVLGDDGRDRWRLADSRSWLLPESTDAMTWRIADHGFVMTLSAQVPDLIARYLRPALLGWLGEHRLSIEDVATWAVHPGGPRILGSVVDALGLAPEAISVSREVLAECGNMSSPTILFILERLHAASAPRPCVALGFGPGLTAEAALLL